jgi:hypothetical protein
LIPSASAILCAGGSTSLANLSLFSETTMPQADDFWTLKKYLLYDFAHDRLASSQLFASHQAAAQAAAGLETVMIVSVVLSRVRAIDETVQCECMRSA